MYNVSLDIGGNKYFYLFIYCLAERTDHRRRIKTQEKVKVVAAVWIQFLPALDISIWMMLKKKMNRIMATWRNGCFEKMDDHQAHAIPNHHPTKMDVLPKTLFKLSLLLKG